MGAPFPPIHYAPAPGRPVFGGVSADDVVQGKLGDCFFLSSLAALAHTHPDLVVRALADHHDGTYAVTLHGAGGRPVDVAVDDLFPETAASDLLFGRGLDPVELWPAIFEKAYAKLRGGYGALNGGGDAGDALKALTGRRAHGHLIASISPAAAWRFLTDAVNAGEPAVTTTPAQRELVRRTGRADMAGLIDDHAYAVLDAYEVNGQRYVLLYTPLSPIDIGYSQTEPRTIEVAFEDWIADFDEVIAGEV
jgi:hypothetical protein